MRDSACRRHTLWCGVSVRSSCVRAVHIAYSDRYAYAVVTEVRDVKIVVVKAPKSLAGILKKMFGIK